MILESARGAPARRRRRRRRRRPREERAGGVAPSLRAGPDVAAWLRRGGARSWLMCPPAPSQAALLPRPLGRPGLLDGEKPAWAREQSQGPPGPGKTAPDHHPQAGEGGSAGRGRGAGAGTRARAAGIQVGGRGRPKAGGGGGGGRENFPCRVPCAVCRVPCASATPLGIASARAPSWAAIILPSPGGSPAPPPLPPPGPRAARSR